MRDGYGTDLKHIRRLKLRLDFTFLLAIKMFFITKLGFLSVVCRIILDTISI